MIFSAITKINKKLGANGHLQFFIKDHRGTGGRQWSSTVFYQRLYGEIGGQFYYLQRYTYQRLLRNWRLMAIFVAITKINKKLEAIGHLQCYIKDYGEIGGQWSSLVLD